MTSLQRCARQNELFGITEIEGGFPHSEIRGSKVVRTSPRLIAAYHVLHRLSAPRHPPNTLKALDRSHYRRPPLGRGSSRFQDDVVDRKTICFKHIRECGGQAAFTTGARSFRPESPQNDRICFLFTMTDSAHHACRDDANSVSRTSRANERRRQSAVWWSQTGSNRRPHACKARALPTELWPRAMQRLEASGRMVGLGRLELPTSRLSSARSNQLSYKPKTCPTHQSARASGALAGRARP